jgi:serine/threonine-protein kinase
VAGAGGAAYFSGVLSPGLPVADPYILTLEQPVNGPARATGHVPSEATATALSQHFAGLGGTTEVTLARGDIGEDWGTGILGILDTVQDLPEWRVEVSGNAVRVEGLTENRSVFDRIEQALNQTATPAGLRLDAAIELGPRMLPVSVLDTILKSHADCGDLLLLNPPPMGFGNTDTIIVAGRLSTAEARDTLTSALRDVSGQRNLEISAQVLNPTLCLFDSVLPSAPSGGFQIEFALGDTGAPVPFGNFTVGQNPVIDLVIPADVTNGYLFVSALDVSGNVFHLMPNVNRQTNGVAALRDGQSGEITIRLAHTLDEAAASGGKKLAFVVDDTALGQTQILVLRSMEELLDGMRPTTESAMSYAEALAARSSGVSSLDTRILTTTKP